MQSRPGHPFLRPPHSPQLRGIYIVGTHEGGDWLTWKGEYLRPKMFEAPGVYYIHYSRVGYQEADSEVGIGGQKVYLGKLLESTHLEGKRKIQPGPKEHMDHETGSVKALVTLVRSSEAEMDFQSCPQWEQRVPSLLHTASHWTYLIYI